VQGADAPGDDTDRRPGRTGAQIPVRRCPVSRTQNSSASDTSLVKNAYRRSPGYQMDDRRVVLRGGPYDGRTWVGVISVGERRFFGDGTWATNGVYVVSKVVEADEDGQEVNVAVPAFA
jgi:hypothetical protein